MPGILMWTLWGAVVGGYMDEVDRSIDLIRGWGALRLTTIGRKSGKQRSVIIGYVEEGPNLVALAMNGWDDGHSSWWLNLEAHPDAVVRLAGQHQRPVWARPAAGDERDRLWQRWVGVDPQIDAYAGLRSTETPVIVLELRDGTARHQERTGVLIR
jgi:F420H(2)-dependent quinone reductase